MAEKTILVADDNDEWRSLVSFWLKKAGYNVVAARDGKGVMPLAEKTPPDCFVLDYELGDMNAGELIRQVRGRFDKAPVIFLTTMARAMIRLPPGCLPEQFIVKSQNSTELLAVLDGYFRE
jgi:CheY-like chemotaxis protein